MYEEVNRISFSIDLCVEFSGMSKDKCEVYPMSRTILNFRG